MPTVIDDLLASSAGVGSAPPPEDVQALLRAANKKADPDSSEEGPPAARRVFANGVVYVHSLYPQASTIELAAMANAMAELATGHGVELELAASPEAFHKARLAFAAGVRGAAAIPDPASALRTAIAVMAQGVVGKMR